LVMGSTCPKVPDKDRARKRKVRRGRLINGFMAIMVIFVSWRLLIKS
jgi:hypothetical protein